ncbi:MAG: dehydrogenase [Verrucomicrobia bacterium]|nr:dehydrogenase [Verrucomicrobiota bacterium]
MVGCGAFGESYLATLAGMTGIEVVAVTDAMPERARRLAKRYSIPNVSPSFQELVARADIDAVCVVTTEDQHFEPVMAALRHGKDVMVEKPMATRLDEAQRMMEAASEHGRVLMPGHLLRFEPRYATVKQQLAEGRLGRVLFLSARRNRTKGQGRIYKRTPLVFETAIHDIDLMLWFTCQKVASVRAWTVAAVAGQEPDLLCAALKFQDGAIGMFHASWLLPDRTAVFDDHLQVLATAGAANVDLLNAGLTLWPESGPEHPDTSYEPRLHGSIQGALREQLIYFARCCREQRLPTIVSAADGVEAVRVCAALVQSAVEDREIDL